MMRSVDDNPTNRVGIDLTNTGLAALAPITFVFWIAIVIRVS